MTSELIKIYNHADSRIADLLAEIDKKGEVTKIYDLNGNELKINFLRDEVYYNKAWWHFQKNKNKITFQYDSSHQNNSYQKYLTTLLIHAQIQVLGF